MTMKIAILGFGTVGSGVYEIVKDNKEVIKNKYGLFFIISKSFNNNIGIL